MSRLSLFAMVETFVDPILAARRSVPDSEAVLVGISGIDASGKGFVTGRLSHLLRGEGFRVAELNVDGWLNLPDVRFDDADPAGNFYRKAIRFEEMFEKLIFPLKKDRSVSLEADFTEETATEYRKHVYGFCDIEFILLEGIFLFKREFAEWFDLRIWIDCPFKIALRRAIVRSQEGLDPVETSLAYETIYFPAQRIHFSMDEPMEAADIVFRNW